MTLTKNPKHNPIPIRERLFAMIFLFSIAILMAASTYLGLNDGLLAALLAIAILVGRHYFRRNKDAEGSVST